VSETVLSGTFLSRLRAFIRRRVGSDADADDLMQDVLAKLVERRGEVSEEGAPAWLYTVARRAIVDRYRARAAGGGAERRGLPAVAEVVEEDAGAARELALCLEPMLERLDPAERELLRRVDMEGMSQAEIARELGVSVSTVKSRTQRARAKLLGVLSECCAVATDARGKPVEYELRKGKSCRGCGPGAGGGGGGGGGCG
jgi:RNA polymerase sigma-70 factor, ECF subfamily